MNSSEIPVQRFEQDGAVECGPASICILFSIFPEFAAKFSITDVIQAAGVGESISTNGTNVRDLAIAVEKLSEGKLQLLFKRNASLSDIRKLLDLGFPVTVDWQGSTLQVSAFSGQEGELGHYSTIVSIDLEKNRIVMVDPIKDFPNQRVVSVDEFEQKWWDTDTLEGENGVEMVRSNKLLFVVLPQNQVEAVSSQLSLQAGDQY